MNDGVKININTLGRLLHELQGHSKFYTLWMILRIIVDGIYPVFLVYMPKVIVDQIIEGKSLHAILFYILIFAGATCLYTNISNILDATTQKIEYATTNTLKERLGSLAMNVKYSYIEKPQMLDDYEKAFRSLLHWSNGITWTTQICMKFVSSVISVVGVLLILIRRQQLFILLLPLFVIGIIIIQKKKSSYDEPFFSQMVKYNREFRYYTKVMKDVTFGKEIRLYDTEDLLGKHIDEYQVYADKIFKERARLRSGSELFNSLIQGIYYILMYTFLAIKTIVGSVTIGDFVLLSNAYTNFMSISLGVFGNYFEVNRCLHFFKIFFEFFETYGKEVEEENSSLMPIPKDCESGITIEFSDVWFRYDENQEYVLKNVNVKINSNEALSIVGRNGAGKTTFIKLLLRLYEPSKGVIKLNGIDIRLLSKEDYYSKIATVFQDFQIYAASVKENVVMSKPFDENKFRKALQDVNLLGVIDKLSKKEETEVSKLFDKDGVDFSGGQRQRLAIARAIYKETEFLVLDEPTSSLDPKMEDEIFSQVYKLADTKGIVFISHRLSSCKNSDRIIVFDQGSIVQEGTHQEFIVQKDMLYYELFTAQAK